MAVDVKKVIKGERHFCVEKGVVVDITGGLGRCARVNGCTDPDKCPLYLEWMIRQTAEFIGVAARSESHG